ncbi:MAG: D-glycero-beta-D-manno-heptose 1-phosphate adenylyltransferase [Cytophagales bacterium CG12_big_fil_rev_8_21_14_0_65_40_12]|nr:MAG: D-glycero-beta-D-manno-heptose 1-phosphate adenylyltransferase [Cytophagales bacterium CG12_big_fil_rev_8_21_14_0_65_40_12]PIW03059.1 MAG: D-glycero-beta-D-manno-heptose 1-phosphate adenylyltransferase [Cytophagales bacterium CG17_big_fil_post_rev_8_21_14_2_50_40_13]
MESKNKINSWQGLKEQVELWKKAGEKVVFSNGCFDILHLGHIDYLEKARSLGNRLVIGLNDDDSVRQLKGAERPVNNEIARARLLAALEFVDGVTIFSEDTPKELIAFLIPDILVKGSDYNVDNIVGADIVLANGGEVKTIDLVNGYSTSNLINKLKK